MSDTTYAPRNRTLLLAIRYALRELRSGLRGFYVFIACIALGVMAIAGVGSVAGSLSEGLEHQGRTLLGGDASFALIQREATPEERSFLDSRGKVSSAAIMRAMARSDRGEFALVDLKAVDDNYPMLGDVKLTPPIAREVCSVVAAVARSIVMLFGIWASMLSCATWETLDVKTIEVV